MSGLLQNARRFFKGLAPAAPVRAQSYAVLCTNGHRLSGTRSEGYQAIRCPTCGVGVFVLPRSPLPEPPKASPTPRATTSVAPGNNLDEPAAERPRVPPQSIADLYPEDDLNAAPAVAPAPPPLRQPAYGDGRGVPEFAPATDRGDVVDEIEWVDDDVVPQSQTPTSVAPAGRARGPERAGRTAAPRDPSSPRPSRAPKPPAPPRAAEPAVAVVREPWTARLLRHRNSLIFTGVLILVAGTTGWRVWRSRLADLPRIAEIGRVEGIMALDLGKFDRAHQILSEARRAVVRMGDAFQGAEAIKQAADEAEIIVQLLPGSLESLLDEAARADANEWSSRFETLYKGRSIIVDGHFTAVPDGQGNGRYELDYTIIPEGGDGGPARTRGRIDLQGLRRLDLIRPRLGDGIRLGARLAAFQFDLDREEWRVRLEPESGVVMTHDKALEALGWPRAEDLPTEAAP